MRTNRNNIVALCIVAGIIMAASSAPLYFVAGKSHVFWISVVMTALFIPVLFWMSKIVIRRDHDKTLPETDTKTSDSAAAGTIPSPTPATTDPQLVARAKAFFSAVEPRAMVRMPSCAFLLPNRQFARTFAIAFVNDTPIETFLEIIAAALKDGWRCVCSLIDKVEALRANQCGVELLYQREFGDERLNPGPVPVSTMPPDVWDFLIKDRTTAIGRYIPARFALRPLNPATSEDTNSSVHELIVLDYIPEAIEVTTTLSGDVSSTGSEQEIQVESTYRGVKHRLTLCATNRADDVQALFEHVRFCNRMRLNLETGDSLTDVLKSIRDLKAVEEKQRNYPAAEVLHAILKDDKDIDRLRLALDLRVNRLADVFLLRKLADQGVFDRVPTRESNDDLAEARAAA